MTLTLVAISYSPWSERARWALDHHDVSYREQEHLPFLAEPILRLRMRKLRGTVSVPVLLTEHGAIEDSWDIARHAEAVGGRASLFSDLEACRSWTDRSQLAMEAGRARASDATLADPEAQREALPPLIPGALRGASTGVTRWAAKKLVRKYGRGDGDAMPTLLADARAALDGGDHLVGASFSFADIALCGALEFVSPYAGGARGTRAGHRRYRRGPATRRVWTDEALAREYADLLEWRDRTYANHR